MKHPVSEICILQLIRMVSLVYMILVLVNCDVVYGGKGSYYLDAVGAHGVMNTGELMQWT